MTQWGPAIQVDGKRPDWLRDHTQRVQRISPGYPDWTNDARSIAWSRTTAIRLPADHAYYTATDAGFTYWPGGDSAPSDWDGDEVLMDDPIGKMPAPRDVAQWLTRKDSMLRPIIGYRKRPELETFTDKEFEAKYGETLEWQSVSGSKAILIQPRTQAEWDNIPGGLSQWLKDAGLIIEPTDAERAATLASDVAPGVACAGSLVLQGIALGRQLERDGK